MKILFVDLQYDYGMKHRGPNEIGERGFRRAFERLGHEVECFYYDDYLKRQPELQTALLEKAKSYSPDLIYFILFGEQFEITTLQQLKKSYKTMNWFGDDQWRFDNFTKKYAPHFTYSVTTDPFAISKYHQIGIKEVFLSQWAALEYEVAPEASTQYEYDVSFVGGSHSVRRWFIKELAKRGIKVATFGYGWPAGPISLMKMADIFRSSKVNLNLSNSITYDLRYLMSNIKNPIVALKSDKAASQMKARNFEIPYLGGFQMTDYVPFLEKYLDVGNEIVCYRDVDEAAKLIRFYLENDQERERIKAAGIQRARSEHGYFHRHQKVFEQLP
ncbi:MAG: glycosyltransferase [Bdellovibrionaceae bacterium]|nr:glycosyltransferase [Pseudobdellovibrionaceae bacterium]